MVYKIRFKDYPNGYTLIELLITVCIILVLTAAMLLFLNPADALMRDRDQRRISDISVIERAIIEYKVDYGSYPDSNNTARTSTVLPLGSGAFTSAKSGWIKQDLSSYISKLPIDPKNDTTYFYKYIRVNDTYELDAKLEYYTDKAQNDGGNSATTYEVGNNLTLL